MPDKPSKAAQPVQPGERIDELDILRGFAIFGILLVNMMFFAHPIYREVLDLPWQHPLDRLADALITFFAQGKFFTLFSLLFGIGLTIQMKRADAKGATVVPLFVRRMLILLAIGAAHTVLFWFGDILLYYSILGLALLLFRHLEPRRLLKWAVALLAVPMVVNSALVGLFELGRAVPNGAAQIEVVIGEAEAEYLAQYQQALETYAAGTFAEMTAQRLQDFGFEVIGLTLNGMLFIVLAMFLLGLYAGKRGLVDDIGGNLSLYRRVFRWSLAVGVAANLAFVLFGLEASPVVPSGALLLSVIGFIIGAPALCLAYASGIMLLARQRAWRARLMVFAPVGRAALSNYLFQTLVCTTIFYSYGLGLYGQVGPAAGIVLTVAIFGVQVGLSRWWLGRFRYGPVEWLWRSLTYGRAQPMATSEHRQAGTGG